MFQTIMLSGFTIWFWGLVLVRAFSHFIIVHSLYKDRYNSIATLLMSFGFTLFYEIFAYNFTYFPVNEYDWNYILAQILMHISVFAFVILASEKATFKKTIFKCIFVDFLIFCRTLIAGMIDMFLVTNLSPELAKFNDTLTYYEWTKSEYFIMSVLTLVVSYLIVFFVKLFKVNTKNTFQLKYLYFYLVPLTCIFPVFSVIISSEQMLTNTFENNKYYSNQAFSNFELLSLLFAIIVAFSSIFVIDAIQKSDEKMKQLAQTVAKNEFDVKNIEFVKSRNEQTQKINHDIKNILGMANLFIENGEIDKTKGLINQATNELSSVSGVPLCRNGIINTALYIKSNEAKQYGISLKIDIDESNDAHINDLDLSRILLNLCDNAINAVKECDDKTVNIRIDIGDKLIKIGTSNHFIKKKKVIKAGHGNGEKIITEIAKKYGGTYEKSATDDMYTTSTTMRNIEIV